MVADKYLKQSKIRSQEKDKELKKIMRAKDQEARIKHSKEEEVMNRYEMILNMKR